MQWYYLQNAKLAAIFKVAAITYFFAKISDSKTT